jgi:hypothetical protein
MDMPKINNDGGLYSVRIVNTLDLKPVIEIVIVPKISMNINFRDNLMEYVAYQMHQLTFDNGFVKDNSVYKFGWDMSMAFQLPNLCRLLASLGFCIFEGSEATLNEHIRKKYAEDYPNNWL